MSIVFLTISFYSQGGEEILLSNRHVLREIYVNEYTLLMNLTIKNLEKSDFGEYVCASANALGKAEDTVKLQGT